MNWRRVGRVLSLGVLGFGLLVNVWLGVLGALWFLLGSRAERRWPLKVPALAVVGSALLASLASQWRLRALAGWGLLSLAGLAGVLFYTRLRREDRGPLVAGLALGLLAAGGLSSWQVVIAGEAQARAFAFHPNYAGHVALIGVFGVAAGLALARSRWLRLLCLLGLAGGLAALVYAGSRGAYLGFLVGLVVMLGGAAAARRPGGRFRRRRRAVLLGVIVVGSLVLAYGVYGELTAGATPNLLVNSGFERGGVMWTFGGGSELVPGGAEGGYAVRTAYDRPGWQVLLTPRVPLPAAAGRSYTLSLFVRPAESAIKGAMVRIEALDERGRFIARAGREGWTTGDESRAGGRLLLPREPAGEWRRFTAVLAPTPAGTAQLRVMIADDSRDLGEYGLIDALQLEPGAAASSYREGPRPGLAAYLGPLVPRLLALADPLGTSGGRLSMWRFSLELAAARPFLGYGFGANERLVQRLAPEYLAFPLAHPHNAYLELLLEGGSLTLVATLLLAGLIAGRLIGGARRGSLAAAAALAALAGAFSHDLVDSFLKYGQVAGLLWLVLCLGLLEEEVAGED